MIYCDQYWDQTKEKEGKLLRNPQLLIKFL